MKGWNKDCHYHRPQQFFFLLLSGGNWKPFDGVLWESYHVLVVAAAVTEEAMTPPRWCHEDENPLCARSLKVTWKMMGRDSGIVALYCLE